MQPTVYLAIPCYNEEAALPETARRLREKFDALLAEGKVSPASRICFIDDGSKDGTWALIEALHRENRVFSGLKLSRNRGHQNALLCALMTLCDRADCVISMDADLQDDINAMDEMLQKFSEGCDVVYGVRLDRRTDSALKRFTAEGYYRLLRCMGAEVVFNHADYRLLSRRALQALSQYGESNVYLRGLVPMLGYQSGTVYYARGERVAGESKYPLKKMLALAWEGITSLTMKPIRIVTAVGVLVTLVGLAVFVLLLVRLCAGLTQPAWGLPVASVWTVGGLQLLAAGVIGEYVGKTYLEAKHRPRYFVECELDERPTDIAPH